MILYRKKKLIFVELSVHQTGAQQEAGNPTLIIRVKIIVVVDEMFAVYRYPHPSLSLLQYVFTKPISSSLCAMCSVHYVEFVLSSIQNVVENRHTT